MEPLYRESSTVGPLRQGEILKGIREIRFKAIDLPEEITAESILASTIVQEHPFTIVLSPDCDLEWDYQARKKQANADTKLISHVLLCDLEDQSSIRAERVKPSREFRRVKQNREERYHYLRSSPTDFGSQVGEFYIDFKRMFALPTEYIIRESESGRITRLGILKPPWTQHLTHRFTFFLGRVGLPDEE